MDIKILIRKILAQTKNTYTKNDIANLAKKMKESDPKEMEKIWFEFQDKHRITFDKLDIFHI